MKFNNKIYSPVAAVLLAGSMSSLWAVDRVLIMGISQYEGVISSQKIPDLPGIGLDIQNAQKIAQKLGFNTSNATVLREADLRKDNFIQNIEKFSASVKNSDRVFVYYTGHGMRTVDTDGKCKEGFIASDSRLIEQDTISDALAKLKNRAKEVTAIFDACHAGGVAVAAGERGGVLTKRASMASEWVIKGGVPSTSSADVCATPTNYIARGIGKIKNETGVQGVEKNFTYIAAAIASEYAIAGSKGSLATSTLLSCLNNGVQTLNANATTAVTPTVQDLLSCAQTDINQQMPNIKLHNKSWQGMTIAAAGNTARPLWNVTAKVEEQKPVVVSTGGNSANQNPNVIQSPPATFNSALSAMRILEADSDKRWGLQLQGVQSELPIGAKFTLPYKAAQGGYFYIFAASSDGLQSRLLYPKEKGQQRYRANSKGYVGGDPPGPNVPIELEIQAPASENHFLVLISASPMNFDHLKIFNQNEGSRGFDAASLAELSKSMRSGLARQVGVTEAGGSSTANPLAGTYGAAYFVIKGRNYKS